MMPKRFSRKCFSAISDSRPSDRPACPDFIAAGPPPPTPPPIIGDYADCLRKLGPLSWLCPKG